MTCGHVAIGLTLSIHCMVTISNYYYNICINFMEFRIFENVDLTSQVWF